MYMRNVGEGYDRIPPLLLSETSKQRVILARCTCITMLLIVHSNEGRFRRDDRDEQDVLSQVVAGSDWLLQYETGDPFDYIASR